LILCNLTYNEKKDLELEIDSLRNFSFKTYTKK
jgi:hypothetical protein